MTINEMLNNDAFKCIEREKLYIMLEISKKINGKTPMEALDVVISYKDKLSGGKPLTEYEKNAIIEVLKQSINEEEKKKFIDTINILKDMGKL